MELRVLGLVVSNTIILEDKKKIKKRQKRTEREQRDKFRVSN